MSNSAPVSRAYAATPRQVEAAKRDVSFQVRLEGTRQTLQREMCDRLATAATAAEQDRLTDGYWNAIVRAQGQMRADYPQHRVVLRDLDRNARVFQRGVSWADYQQSCSRHGVNLRRAR